MDWNKFLMTIDDASAEFMSEHVLDEITPRRQTLPNTDKIQWDRRHRSGKYSQNKTIKKITFI